MKNSQWLFLILSMVFISACGDPPVGEPFYGALGAGEARIIISTATTGSQSVSMYDEEGNFQAVIKDYTSEALNPRGLVAVDFASFFISVDSNDRIDKGTVFGEVNTEITSAFFSGNLYHMTRISDEVFAIESNVIESFQISSGARVGNPRIATTVGGCTLSTPRGITVNGSNYIVTVGTGNDDLNVYDVSNSASTTCITANTSMGNINPTAVTYHSNGNLYVATQGDDSIYQFSGDGSGTGTAIFNNTTYVNNPTAILEMSDGSILVASDATNDIVRMDTSGNLVAPVPFMENSFTQLVYSMILMPGSD